MSFSFSVKYLSSSQFLPSKNLHYLFMAKIIPAYTIYTIIPAYTNCLIKKELDKYVS